MMQVGAPADRLDRLHNRRAIPRRGFERDRRRYGRNVAVFSCVHLTHPSVPRSNDKVWKSGDQVLQKTAATL